MNKTGSFIVMWMDLESIIQSVISQKKKNKYSILKHMNGIQKDSRNEAICRAEIEMQDGENKHVGTVRGGKREH